MSEKGYIIVTYYRMMFSDGWGVWNHIRLFKKYYIKYETAEEAIRQCIHAHDSKNFEYKHTITEFDYQRISPNTPTT